MTAVRVAVGLGLALLALLCWLAAQGFAAVTEILITLAALVGMIAGGSWLSGKMGIYGHGRQAAAPAARGAPATGATGPRDGRYCPGTELVARASRRSGTGEPPPAAAADAPGGEPGR